MGAGRLAPSVEISVRHDSGAETTGTGAAGSAGLRYRLPAAGLTVAGRGHGFTTFGADYREWGADLTVGLDPGAPSRGLIVDVSTEYGAQQRRTDVVWESDSTDYATADYYPAGRLAVDVRYGLAAFGGAGFVTPYSGVQLSQTEQRYRLGVRLGGGSGITVSLGGERRQSNAGAVEHELHLSGNLRL